MIRAVIFDLDGTLVHSLPGLTSSLNRVLTKNNLPTHEEPDVRTFIGNGIQKLIQRATPTDTPSDLLQHLTTQMSEDYASTWRDGTSAYPMVPEVLQDLANQGLKLAVFSNKPHRFCREMTDFLFPEIAFTSVLGQRDGIPIKPNPAGAIDISKDLNIPSPQMAFLGDSTIDVITAKNAGMPAIAATWGYHDVPNLIAEQPDDLIHDISEFPHALDSLV